MQRKIVRNQLLFLIIFIGLITINCEKNPVRAKDESYFGIYFLQNDTLKMEDVYNADLDDLQLLSEPWLNDKDIRFYDWSSHCIYLKKDKTCFILGWQNGERFSVFPAEWADKPFVVVANGNRCYLGYFFRIELSMDMWIAPMVGDVGFNSMYPSDVIWIDWAWLYHEYPQNSPNVKDALIEAGLYHGGISITFDTTDVNTLSMIENADTSTISYKFTIVNNDEDDLYILDPDKTDGGIFHRFTNGPVFKNLETGKLYESRWRTHIELSPIDYWSPDWFTKLESGHTINRTVVLKGYPYFPTGEYIFEFRYSGPPTNMEKEVREFAGSRYWLGPTRSNILVWNYKADDDSLLNKNFFVERYTHSPNEYLHIASTQQQLEFKRR